jgi:hypothetical protein
MAYFSHSYHDFKPKYCKTVKLKTLSTYWIESPGNQERHESIMSLFILYFNFRFKFKSMVRMREMSHSYCYHSTSFALSIQSSLCFPSSFHHLVPSTSCSLILVPASHPSKNKTSSLPLCLKTIPNLNPKTKPENSISILLSDHCFPRCFLISSTSLLVIHSQYLDDVLTCIPPIISKKNLSCKHFV